MTDARKPAAEDKVETFKADVKDAADELKNRAQAAGERADRAVKGDRMPLGEAIKSHVAQKVRETKAEIDRAKREVRHEDA
jgi:hypothetical protein